ncbi:hypothetical protein LZ30DRAFT_709844 [Colletotrichum cereale]|nr:hypothetical protein LZ30DRAFT_709844 [Colletotrichum cereale]
MWTIAQNTPEYPYMVEKDHRGFEVPLPLRPALRRTNGWVTVNSRRRRGVKRAIFLIHRTSNRAVEGALEEEKKNKLEDTSKNVRSLQAPHDIALVFCYLILRLFRRDDDAHRSWESAAHARSRPGQRCGVTNMVQRRPAGNWNTLLDWPVVTVYSVLWTLFVHESHQPSTYLFPADFKHVQTTASRPPLSTRRPRCPQQDTMNPGNRSFRVYRQKAPPHGTP